MNHTIIEWPRDMLSWLDSDMTKLTLLLPTDQAVEVERLAHASCLTVGEWLRLLIQEQLTTFHASREVAERNAGG